VENINTESSNYRRCYTNQKFFICSW
jgi:hypothetical protein